jgi:hypothetical protein
MDYRILKNVLNLVKLVLVLLGAALTVIIWSKFNLAGPGAEKVTEMDLILEESGYGLKLAYWLTGICGGAIIIFSLYQVVLNFKRSIPALIGFIIFGAILLLSYGMASSEIPAYISEQENLDVTSFMYQVVGGGIISLYIFLGLTVLTIFLGEVYRILIGSKS